MTGSLNGVINIYKEKGFTSHDAVAVIKRLTHSKCGHTGTLDPDAEGVLPVCLGKATRIADYITAGVKHYTAKVVFGTETDTQDASGKVIENGFIEAGIGEIKAVLQSFVGEYAQIPPMYSAIKQNGQKLYELARKGAVTEREPRLVHIVSIELLDFDLTATPRTIEIAVVCSKGTYIRTLCSDIGKRLNGCAHMGSLIRTRSGVFDVKQSVKISEIRSRTENGTLNEIIIPIEKALSEFNRAVVSENGEKLLYNGNKLGFDLADFANEPQSDEKLLVYDKVNNLIGIYTFQIQNDSEKFLKPLTILYNRG